MKKQISNWIYILGLIPTIWLALLVAPSIDGGLPQIIKDFPSKIDNPFNIIYCNNSIKAILICSIVYAFCIGIYISTK